MLVFKFDYRITQKTESLNRYYSNQKLSPAEWRGLLKPLYSPVKIRHSPFYPSPWRSLPRRYYSAPEHSERIPWWKSHARSSWSEVRLHNQTSLSEAPWP